MSDKIQMIHKRTFEWRLNSEIVEWNIFEGFVQRLGDINFSDFL
jgi:hypothetical protein